MKKVYVDEMRSFSRFYTNILGLLNTHILDSRFSLAEVRTLYELYHHKEYTAKDLVDALHIDKGQLSRMLLKFENEKLIKRFTSGGDKRSRILSLTKKGMTEFEILDRTSTNQVMQLLSHLDDKKLAELLVHMKEIQKLLVPIHE